MTSSCLLFFSLIPSSEGKKSWVFAPAVGLHRRCWAITPSSSHICIATATEHGTGTPGFRGTRPRLDDATRRDGKGETITTCFLGGFVWWNFLWRLWLNCWWFCCSFSNVFRSKSTTIVRIGFCWQLVWNWIPWCLCSRMVFVKSIFPYFQMRNLWPGEKDLSRSTSSDHPVIEWYVVIPI